MTKETKEITIIKTNNTYSKLAYSNSTNPTYISIYDNLDNKNKNQNINRELQIFVQSPEKVKNEQNLIKSFLRRHPLNTKYHFAWSQFDSDSIDD